MTDSYSRRQLAGSAVNEPTREEFEANRVRDINQYNAENKDQTIPVGHIIEEQIPFLGAGKMRYKRWDGTKYVSATKSEYETYVNTKGFIGPPNPQGIIQKTADLYEGGKLPAGGAGGGVEPQEVNKPIDIPDTTFNPSSWESKNTNLRYPYERMESTQDYIQFSVIEYKRQGLTGGPVGTNRLNQGTGVQSQFSTQIPERNLNTDILGTVTLPVPSQIGDNNGASFGPGNLNFLQEQGIGIAQAGIEGAPQEALRKAQELVEGLVSESGRGLAKNFFANQAVSAFGGNLSLDQLLARDQGIIINPNMELLFTGPKLRSFTFAFKFTPRFSKEAEEIKKIIRVFKKHSSPRKGSNFLKSPDIFQIRYLGEGSRNHKFLNRFKLCALTNMTVNYTGDGVYATYNDGTPVSSIMTLTFNELTPVYNEDYNDTVGGVGY